VTAILLGESANIPRRPTAEALWGWDLALRYGAFNAGAGRRRLESLGLWLPERANLLPPGVGWDAALAARYWADFRPRLEAYGAVVLCGARLARLAGVPLLERRGRWVAIPHPSGRCRLWNDPSTCLSIAALATGLA